MIELNTRLQDAITWIEKRYQKGDSFESIRFGRREDLKGLKKFLEEQEINNDWEISIEEWLFLVDKIEQDSIEREQQDHNRVTSIVRSSEEVDNNVIVPTSKHSPWISYKNRLLDIHKFSRESVDAIEDSTKKILQSVSSNTVERGPVKGLVVGNVQSGKTANMAALMALGVSNSFNMFIILGGVIENLREQTQKRIQDDLGSAGSVTWNGLTHLNRNSPYTDKLSQKRFDLPGNAYFTVVLKNHKRLEGLIDWIHEDPEKAKQMRILVIDDESDQASVNTGDVTSAERKRINELIVSLVEGRNSKGQIVPNFHYGAMNYIGYTATPYANVLNEATIESLFPKDFIVTLPQAKEYFGPQQIFGIEGRMQGLDVVRIINDEEMEHIQNIHDGNNDSLPKQMEESILWFLCASASLRKKGFRKPLSMLVHTSIRVEHHENMYKAIVVWFNSQHKSAIIDKCKIVWEKEHDKITKEAFQKVMFDYPDDLISNEIFNDFESIQVEVLDIINESIHKINIDDDNELKYGDGIHISVDNGSSQSLADEGEHIRIAYPEDDQLGEKAPLFIVIGGQTLSRGLTINGLISTYVSRATGQGDTLMQMGRWFGYRRGYELYPRIWMPLKTYERFIFLSYLDDQLRESIRLMEIKNQLPYEYGLKITNSPSMAFLSVTSKNKMQSAKEMNFDYTGMRQQITIFDRDIKVQNQNLRLATNFINSLSNPEISESNPYNKSNFIFRNVPFHSIRNEFLSKFKISERSRAFKDSETLYNWIEEITNEGLLDEWNIVVAGKGTASYEPSESEDRWTLQHGSIEIIGRSEKNIYSDSQHKVFGVISGPKDTVSDVNIDLLDNSRNPNYDLEVFKKRGDFNDRDYFGLETVPQLIIYRVRTLNPMDEAHNSDEDIVSIMINIPGGRKDKSRSYAANIGIDMSNFNYDLNVREN